MSGPERLREALCSWTNIGEKRFTEVSIRTQDLRGFQAGQDMARYALKRIGPSIFRMRRQVLHRRIGLAKAIAENPGEIGKHHEAGFGVLCHERAKFLCWKMGDFYQSHANGIRATGLIVDQRDFTENAARADLSQFVSRGSADEHAAVKDDKQIAALFAALDQEFASKKGLALSDRLDLVDDFILQPVDQIVLAEDVGMLHIAPL